MKVKQSKVRTACSVVWMPASLYMKPHFVKSIRSTPPEIPGLGSLSVV